MSQFCFTFRSVELSPLEGLRESVRKDFPYVPLEYEEWEAFKNCFDAILGHTGKFIDYYSWKEFEGPELDVVAEEFRAMKKKIESSQEPMEIPVKYINAVTGISNQDSSLNLDRVHLSSLLQRTLDLIHVAKIDGKVFVCKGP